MPRQSAAARTNELLEKLIAMNIAKQTETEMYDRDRDLVNTVVNPLNNIDTIDKKKIVIDARIGYMIIATVIIAAYSITSVYNNITTDISKLKEAPIAIAKVEAVEAQQDKQLTILESKQEEMLAKISDISDDTKRLNAQVGAALSKQQR